MNKIISIFEEYDETTEKNKSEIYIDYLNKNKKTFKETATNYSSLIEVEGQDEKYFFSEKGQNQKFFLLLNKLKNEIKKSNVIVEDVPSTSINYFNTAINSIQHHKQVFNIDIKACYISIAHREKLILPAYFRHAD